MTLADVEVWSLVGLFLLAAALCLWAEFTGGPAGDPRPVRVPLHSRKNAEDVTRRLNWPTSELPVMERDGGMAQRLPRPEDMPWQAHDDRPAKGRNPRPRPRPLD
jgi:hypothetical protein